MCFAYVNGSVYNQNVQQKVKGTSEDFYLSLSECVAAVEAGKDDAAVTGVSGVSTTIIPPCSLRSAVWCDRRRAAGSQRRGVGPRPEEHDLGLFRGTTGRAAPHHRIAAPRQTRDTPFLSPGKKGTRPFLPVWQTRDTPFLSPGKKGTRPFLPVWQTRDTPGKQGRVPSLPVKGVSLLCRLSRFSPRGRPVGRADPGRTAAGSAS